MTGREQRRRPRAIALDEAPLASDVPSASEERDVLLVAEPRRPQALDPDTIRFEEDAFALEAEAVVAASEPLPVARRGGWLAVAASAFLGLIGIAFGLWIESLIGRLFAIAPWAGIIGAVLAVVLVVALFAIAIRELIGIRRLGTRAALRARADLARQANDDAEAKRIAADLIATFSERPETARGRTLLQQSDRDVMDAGDRLALVEEHLLGPLDREAKAVVLAGAKRVSLVTAVAPRALIDIAYVVLENARTVRRVAAIYGIRPGRLGFLKLFRDVIGHLAVTGAIAAGDSLIGEAFGHGLASRISTKLGEGVVNGLLTARVGISAMDLCRPLPFERVARPTIGEMSRELVRIVPSDRARTNIR